MTLLNKKPLSIYIHWPFCKSKCGYCDFNSHVEQEINKEEWRSAYLKELSSFEEYIKGREIKTIFFGGGTPSLMPPIIVDSIIKKLSDIASFGDDLEVTLEGNPTSVEANKFKEFKAAGVNRVSLGVQSFNQENLVYLTRQHDASEALKAINIAREVFDRYSFDLIYGLPSQSLSSWKEELQTALAFAVDHISLYQLTIEKGTKFYSLYKQGKLIMPDEEILEDFYDTTCDMLGKRGYNRYEISNYALPNMESRHNMAYWKYSEYIGIGAGAHSRVENYNGGQGIYAIMTVHKPAAWFEKVKEVGSGIQSAIKLSVDDVAKEIILTGLRIEEGMSNSRFYELIGRNYYEVIDQKILLQLSNQGLIKYSSNNLKLTGKGFKLYNYIVSKLFEFIIY